MRSALAVGVGLLLILSSLFLKVGAINGMSATFDEPFQIFEGVYYHQQGKWQTRDVHSPLLSWLVGAISPKIAPFQDKKKFSENPLDYFGPYQYRLDTFSGLSSDIALVRACWNSLFEWYPVS